MKTGAGETPAGQDPRELDRTLDTIGWGAFFLWIGVAWLAGLGWGVGLLGTGLIILGEEVARKIYAVRIEKFWVAIGLLFTMSGLWISANVRVAMVPFVCLMAGVALLASAFTRSRFPRA